MNLRRTRDGAQITVTVAFFMSMCFFGAQWTFWDGFVKSSGDRYVDPFELLHLFSFLVLSEALF